MTVRECYKAMGNDYDGVLSRFRNESLIEKFTIKFLSDPSYENLRRSLEKGNASDAFLAVHTLKGISQNLGFQKLYETSCLLTEALRGGRLHKDNRLMQQVQKAYEETVSVIRKLPGVTA